MSIPKPILAGDIGGTKTLLGLFDAAQGRPRPIEVREFPTLAYPDLETLAAEFASAGAMRGVEVGVACFGVAGPVIDGTAELTNVPWRIDGRGVSRALGIARVVVLNDLQAMACALPALEDRELHVLQAGRATPAGNMAILAAGTGLGEAMLHRTAGRLVAVPSEGGHADFAARTERDVLLLRDLTRRYGRASVEHVVSGPGLTNLHRVTHTGPCAALAPGAEEGPAAPAAISVAALERRCPGCVEALEMFVEAYGAEAGNHALRTVATAGLFIGGGIAPKILPALTDGRFIRAFLSKGPLEDLLANVPVKVITNAEAGLLGAAVFAASLG